MVRKKTRLEDKKPTPYLNKRGIFNKKVQDCISDCKLYDNSTTKPFNLNKIPYKDEKEYQASFSEIIAFSKK